MLQLLIKAALSGLIIALIAEIGKRSPTFAALIASLPLVSVLGMIWLYRDTADTERLAVHAVATFWYVLPSLPMFLLCPWLWRQGMNFYLGLLLGCVLTVLLYLLMRAALTRFGMAI